MVIQNFTHVHATHNLIDFNSGKVTKVARKWIGGYAKNSVTSQLLKWIIIYLVLERGWKRGISEENIALKF